MQGTYYRDYLGLDKLLGTQNPVTRLEGEEIHDEMLFIVVHQVYELWFKQIIHELRHIENLFSKDSVAEKDINKVVFSLNRIKKIQGQLTGPLEILETMTPMDFLEFRDKLVPASGFQSIQFREIEIRMGITEASKTPVDRKFFTGRLDEKDREYVEGLKCSSLFKMVETWLERMPFTSLKDFNFWASYKESVDEMLKNEEEIIKSNLASLDSIQTQAQLANLKTTENHFKNLMEKSLFDRLIETGDKKLSHKATLNALFILLYRDEPLLFQPFQLITTLMDIDENFTAWRYRHAILAQRMLGAKVGTGGSSGHQYLKRTAENNRIFLDLFNLSSFLVPKKSLPKLPIELQKKLSFFYEN